MGELTELEKSCSSSCRRQHLQSKIGLTLSLIVGQQDKMLYAFQLHSFSLSDVDKSIHQLQAPECMKKIIGNKIKIENRNKIVKIKIFTLKYLLNESHVAQE